MVRTVIEQAALAGTSQTLTLAAAPTAGNRLLLAVIPDKIAGTFGTPTDDGTGTWSLVGTAYEGEDGVSGALFTKVSDGTETEIVASWANSRNALLMFVEVTGAGAVDQYGLSTQHGVSTGRSSGTITAAGAVADAPQLALAFIGVDSALSTDAATIVGWSNGFIEIDSMGMGAVNYNTAGDFPSGSIGAKQIEAIGTPATEYTWTGDAADETMGMLVTIKAA